MDGRFQNVGHGHVGRTALAAEIELAGLQQGRIGDHADHFAAGDDQPALGGKLPGPFEHQMRRGDVEVGQIDRDLRPAVGVGIPADGLAELELARPADLLTDDAGDNRGCLRRPVRGDRSRERLAMPFGLFQRFADKLAIAAGKVVFLVEENLAFAVVGRGRGARATRPFSRSSKAMSVAAVASFVLSVTL